MYNQILRPETRSLKYVQLTENQKNALTFSIKGLWEAASFLENSDCSPEHSYQTQQSRLIFISGSRGIGKTTLLMSLQELLHPQTHYSEIIDEQFSKLNTEIEQLKKQVEWLDTIETECISDSTNLLASIIVRLEKAVEKKMEKNPYVNSLNEEYLCAQTLESDNPLNQFNVLANNVALSWNGNVPERGARLDPDSFAQEVLQAERASMNINRQLSIVLDNFSKQKFIPDNPLFVLPIDDFDQNPSRCLEILKLIRLISVPRLFFIILGDIHIVEEISQLKIANDLAAVSDKAIGTELIDKHYKELSSMISSISTDTLYKLIPFNQIFFIKKMSPLQALDFEFISFPNNSNNSSIHRVLKKIQLHKINLYEFFRRSNNYYGLRIFGTSTRILLDLLIRFNNIAEEINTDNLQSLKEESTYQQLIAVIIELLQQSINRDNRLSLENKKRIKDGIASFKQKKTLDSLLFIKCSSNHSQPKTISLGKSEDYSIQLNIPQRIDLNISDSEQFFSDESMGWLIFLNDLLFFQDQEFSIISMDILNYFPWVRTLWETNYIPWPVSENKPVSFNHLNILKNIFCQIDKKLTAGNTTEKLIAAWIKFVINDSAIIEYETYDSKKIDQIIDELAIDQLELDDYSLASVINILVFISPEMGMPPSYSKKILSKLKLKNMRALEKCASIVCEKRGHNLLKLKEYHEQFGVINEKLEEIQEFFDFHSILNPKPNQKKSALHFYEINFKDVEQFFKRFINSKAADRELIFQEDTNIEKYIKDIINDGIEIETRKHPINTFKNGIFRPRLRHLQHD